MTTGRRPMISTPRPPPAGLSKPPVRPLQSRSIRRVRASSRQRSSKTAARWRGSIQQDEKRASRWLDIGTKAFGRTAQTGRPFCYHSGETMEDVVNVIGGGLAGVEAAWQAARLGAQV